MLATAERGGAASRASSRCSASGSTRLLVAPSVREGLADVSTRALVVVHDREASQVPWELLHDGSGFPALGRGLSRRYASDTLTPARWRASARAGQPRRVLIVADPTEDLPSAREEGAALQSLLHAAGVQVRLLLGRQATRNRILRALAAEPLDALHFAGHAYFVSSNPAHGGLVCANDEVLRGSDLDGQGDLPALVFFNACEAARVRRRARAPFVALPACGHARSASPRHSSPVASPTSSVRTGPSATPPPVCSRPASTRACCAASRPRSGHSGVAPPAARPRAGRLGRLRALRKPRLRATCVTKRSPIDAENRDDGHDSCCSSGSRTIARQVDASAPIGTGAGAVHEPVPQLEKRIMKSRIACHRRCRARGRVRHRGRSTTRLEFQCHGYGREELPREQRRYRTSARTRRPPAL